MGTLHLLFASSFSPRALLWALLLLVVSCGGGGGSDAPAVNIDPVSNAGPAQSVTTGTLVVLSGAASSDANSDPLTSTWTLTSKPLGSAATLAGATTVSPTFTADLAGSYVASLVVNDGKVNSTPASVTVTVTAAGANATPVANAGPAQNVTAGTPVTLTGAASSDANSDALTFAWALTTKPAGSTATLAGATTVAPTFTADLAGSYVASLVVNDGKVNSTPVTVTVNSAASNAAPVANAGSAQNVTTGALVTLTGAASSDANSDALTYAWTLTSRPAGSATILADATSASPTITPDLAGSYVASLVVNDGQVNSNPATVTVTAAVGNAAPVANAGAAQTVTTGTPVALTGAASTDANSDALTYSWTLTAKPAGSTATLTGATNASPTFTPDLAGSYVASLVVNDGRVSSSAATVTVTAQAAVAASGRYLLTIGSAQLETYVMPMGAATITRVQLLLDNELIADRSFSPATMLGFLGTFINLPRAAGRHVIEFKLLGQTGTSSDYAINPGSFINVTDKESPFTKLIVLSQPNLVPYTSTLRTGESIRVEFDLP